MSVYRMSKIINCCSTVSRSLPMKIRSGGLRQTSISTEGILKTSDEIPWLNSFRIKRLIILNYSRILLLELCNIVFRRSLGFHLIVLHESSFSQTAWGNNNYLLPSNMHFIRSDSISNSWVKVEKNWIKFKKWSRYLMNIRNINPFLRQVSP